jgi:protein-disulfide isomerase
MDEMKRGVLASPVHPRDHTWGPPCAPVTLVEYGDYQSLQCGVAYVVLQLVLQQLGDDVRFVFRHFPVVDPHPRAQAAAEAAESVGARGGEDAFWAMHDILFENQDALEDDDLIAYAEAAGADPHAVADDLASRGMAPCVQADVCSGMQSGVDAAPTFFVNGRRYEGIWTDAWAFAEALRAEARRARRC